MKKQVKRQLNSNILYDLEGDLDDTILYLQNTKNSRPDYSRFELEVEYNYDQVDLVLYGWREETDQEYESRKNEEKKDAEKKKKIKESVEKKERELLEKLKKKYEA